MGYTILIPKIFFFEFLKNKYNIYIEEILANIIVILNIKKNTHAFLLIHISYIPVFKYAIYNILININCGYFFLIIHIFI